MFFFFNCTATTEIYTYWHTLSLHDALPIWLTRPQTRRRCSVLRRCRRGSAIVCCGIGAQPISGATHCMQELVREWFVDDVAQRMHVRAQNVTVRNFVAPQQIFELLTRDHAAVLTQQELENAANRAIQLQQLARTAHFQRARVVFEIRHTQRAGGQSAAGTAMQACRRASSSATAKGLTR